MPEGGLTPKTAPAAPAETSATTAPAVAVRGLVKRYPGGVGVLGIDLDIGRALSRCWVYGLLTACRGVVGPVRGLCSGCGVLVGGAGDLLPDGEADGHLGSVVVCGHLVAAGSEVR
jgi:hypothetical protein